MNIRKTLRMISAAVFIAAAIFTGGCASKTSTTQQVNMSDWEWVPSVWVNNSFAGSKYRGCFFDDSTNGYLCPPGTK